ncbi:MAG: type II toxin-antitoxin system RelE/ParE family toxin [Deltaproteobacteria bacterium]|nr:MAG: type II toxin-antitoxin system RelE/ParE family toxin [Deltaproteobacteria bacterium]
MTDIKEIIQSPVFAEKKKKLHKQQIKDLDKAVKHIFSAPIIGNMKAGDLKGIQVYKFKSGNQQILLSYEVVDSILFLYTFGSHENFYRELKKYLISRV